MIASLVVFIRGYAISHGMKCSGSKDVMWWAGRAFILHMLDCPKDGLIIVV